MCELYRATRPSAAQLEALLSMAIDGTGAQAWDFDPSVTLPDILLDTQFQAPFKSINSGWRSHDSTNFRKSVGRMPRLSA